MTIRAAGMRTCMTALLTFHLSGLGEFMARCHSCSALSPSCADRCGLPEASQARLAQATQMGCHSQKRAVWSSMEDTGLSMNETATAVMASALPSLQHNVAALSKFSCQETQFRDL